MSTEHEALLFDRVQHWKARAAAAEAREAALMKNVQWARDCMMDYVVEIAKLRAALERLRDCDWVITLPDRMDAVRDIARAALETDNG